MATTPLSSLIEPKTFTAYTTQQTTVKSALFNSGVLFTSNDLAAQAGAAGTVFSAPSVNPFAWTESDVMNDDPSVKSTPSGISAAQQTGQKDYRAKSWSVMELASAISGLNASEAVAGKVSDYWVQDYQQMALAKLKGIELGNVASNGGDMVNNVATDATGAATAAQSIGYNTILDTIQTMGDSMDKLGVIIMHSQLFTNLQKAEQIAFARPSETLPFLTYYGKRVIIDDGVPVVAGTNRKTYTTYILGQGAFAFGEATFDLATEVWRDPAAGNGSGEERLYTRKRLAMHPMGFTSQAAITGPARSPTYAQYGVAGAFARVWDRKNIPIAILKTNA